ncbi:MAG: hypothetical protein DHS20C15_28480 [Planctomycetota bacterium]|nr:MAG: hypothetical protein DHS20C15_28480 [Planctomycetota bacterium]
MNDTHLLRLTLIAALLAAGLGLFSLFMNTERATIDASPARTDSALRGEVDRLRTLLDELRSVARRPEVAGDPNKPAPLTTTDGVDLALSERIDTIEQQLMSLQATLDDVLAQLETSFLTPLQLDEEVPMDTAALFDLAQRLNFEEEIGGREHFLWRPHDWLNRYGTPTSWDHNGDTWWWQYELPATGNPTDITQVVVVFSGGLTTRVSVER